MNVKQLPVLFECVMFTIERCLQNVVLNADNAVVLVIRRNQSDPADGHHILWMPEVASHVLQLSVFSTKGQTPELLSGSEVNRQNSEKFFELLQLPSSAD